MGIDKYTYFLASARTISVSFSEMNPGMRNAVTLRPLGLRATAPAERGSQHHGEVHAQCVIWRAGCSTNYGIILFKHSKSGEGDIQQGPSMPVKRERQGRAASTGASNDVIVLDCSDDDDDTPVGVVEPEEEAEKEAEEEVEEVELASAPSASNQVQAEVHIRSYALEYR